MDNNNACGTIKFCQVCQKNVTDVSDMSLKTIKQLVAANNGDMCIKVSPPSIYKNWSRILAKAAAMGLIFLGTLGGQDVLAQKNKTDEPYQITQIATKSSTIVISGVVKGKVTLGWKKLDEAEIFLYSEEGLRIGKYQTDKNGQFTIEVEKKLLGNHFDISFRKYGFWYTSIEKVTIKNANIAVFMDKRKGRYAIGCVAF